jgi:Secretion system C-terminal sorting domain
MKLLLKKLYCNSIKIIGVLLLNILLTTNTALGQVNLIPNASFEDTLDLTLDGRGQSSLHNWHNLDSLRPDNCGFVYLNYNSPDYAIRLPFNGHIQQEPKSGWGFIGLTTFFISSGWSTIRSVPSVRLKNKLSAGIKYCAKAYTSPFDIDDTYTNGFGMYFDNGQLDTIVAQDSSGIYPFVTPQVQAQQPIVEPTNWVKISNTFVANGTETHCHLGNFLSDAATDTIYINSFLVCHCSELAVDEVSLIPVNIANWLHDTSCAIGDSIYIGLPKYEVPDAIWYTTNGTLIDTASGIWVHPTQPITQYIQAIDVCDRIAYDTVTVYAYPTLNRSLAINNFQLSIIPNPAKETFAVQKVYGTKVQLVNMYGQVVQEQKVVHNNATFNVGALARGVYYVKGERQVGKVVLE